MKKLFAFVLLLALTFTFLGVRADTYGFTYLTYPDQGYDLATGKFKTDVTLSSTEKMRIGSNIDSYQLALESLNFHHMLFFNEYNRYIGYINGNQTTLENSMFLGYDADSLTTIPANAEFFVIQNYDYGAFRDQIVVTNPTIDDLAWSDLTYRDIFGDSLFGGSNLVVNSTLEDLTSWSFSYSTGSIENNTLKNLASGSAVAGRSKISIGVDHSQYDEYYISYDYFVPVANTGVNNLRVYLYDSGGNIYNNVSVSTIEKGVWNNTSTIMSYDYVPVNDIEIFLDHTYNLIDIDSTSYVFYDNVIVYNLSNIFNGYTMPTQEQFETMLAFYNQYVDAPETLTYAEIFGNDTRYGGSNNLIENGDFSESLDTNIWEGQYATLSIENGMLKAVGNTATQYFARPLIRHEIIDYNAGDKVYYTASIDYDDSLATADFYSYDNDGVTNALQRIIDPPTIFNLEYTTYSNIITQTFDNNNDIRVGGTYTEYYSITYIDDVRIYNLTDTFYSGLEPDQATFESYYNSWVDPYADYYTEYRDDFDLTLLGFTYTYTPDDFEPDADSGLDNFLSNVNMDNEAGKVFLSVSVLILVAVIGGLLSKNGVITLILVSFAYLVLVFLGWLAIWTLVVASIVLLIIAILKSKSLGGA